MNFDLETLNRSTVYDADGDKVGKVGAIYLDDESGQPSWVTVSTGLFGSNESFIPLQGARSDGDDLHVPFDKATIKDAPNYDPDHHLDANEEEALYRHYNQTRSGVDADRDRSTTAAAGAAGTAGVVSGDRDRDVVDRDRDRDVVDRDRDVVDRDRDRDLDKDGSVVRREERLNVGTEQREAGRARLRKHVVTETQSVDVPVQREELRVEREPISDAEAVRGGSIGEEEQTVTLHEERAVVDKDVVGVEKVRIGKETVTDHETVTEEVRKEEIDVDTEGVADGTRRRGDIDGDGKREI